MIKFLLFTNLDCMKSLPISLIVNLTGQFFFLVVTFSLVYLNDFKSLCNS